MYDEHYGFTDRPFQLTPDARFWFDTAAHKKAMAYLGYGLSQGEGFIVITGDIGAGKTTLMGHLLGKLDRQQLHAITITSTQIEPDDLLRMVAAGLEVAEPGLTKAELLAAIERGLHAVARSGRRTLLIVDEVQALPPAALEELRMLSNIAAGGHALLQIFLLGQPEFRAQLESSAGLEQLRQRVIALHHLGPMGVDEVEHYMAHRLNLVGWSGRPRFTGEAFDALHAGSGGIPRRLNQLAGRVLLHGAMENLNTIDSDTVEAVIAGAAEDLPQRTDGGAVAAGAAEPELLARIARLEERAHDVELAARLDVLEVQAADTGRHAELADRIAALETQAAEAPAGLALAARIAALEEQAADAGRDMELLARLAALEEQAAAPDRHAELAARLAALEEQAVVSSHAEHATRLAALEERAAAAPAELDVAARVTSLEARIEDQDATLRRILTLLVDWVETGQRAPQLDPAAADALSPAPAKQPSASTSLRA